MPEGNFMLPLTLTIRVINKTTRIDVVPHACVFMATWSLNHDFSIFWNVILKLFPVNICDCIVFLVN